MKDNSGNVTAGHLGVAAIVVGLFGGGIFVAKFHSATIGFSMLGALVLLCIYGWVKTPASDKRRIAEAVDKQESTPLGKLGMLAHLIGGTVLVVALVWNLVRWATSS